MTKFIIPFITAFILTAVFIFLLKFAATKINWVCRKSSRHIHKKNAFRLGGIAMILSFILTIFLNADLYISMQLYGVIAALLIILAVGVWDDVREVFWKTQFFYQVSAAIIIFIFGVRIYFVTHPLGGGTIDLSSGLAVIFSIALVIFWAVLMINSMNWLDGIDGLSGGISFIGALTIFFLSLRPEVNQPPVAILAMILAGSSLGFLIFNFYPSMILAGTAGSMFMGFALAFLAIFAGTKIATAILVMALPMIDFVWVIGERFKNRKSIFRPDNNHLHHKLLELGWSQRKIALYYYSVTAMIAIVALNTRMIGKSITLIATVVIMAIALIFINKKLDEKKQV
ncbi:MAG: MraY family glycosyltransferase [Candidatus Moranbacteria bacterium]|nr:MraY family glycosyltransferase [Candidatus Moranbacteria bacterium]